MSKLFNLIAITIVFIFISFSLSLAEERITITTYYPSPYGSYQDLEVNHQFRAKGKGADAQLAIHATTNLGKTSASSGAGTYAVYGEILNTTDPNVTEGVGSDVLGGIGKVWLDPFGTSTQAAVYGSAPLYDTENRYAGYFAGDVRVTGNLSTRCVVISYGANSGRTYCPTDFPNFDDRGMAVSPDGGFFYCCQ